MNDVKGPSISLKAFFGFQRHPFPPACAPEPLFRTDVHDAALRQAHNTLASRGHLLVTAPAGLGKSSFCRLLMAELNPRDFRPLYLVGPPDRAVCRDGQSEGYPAAGKPRRFGVRDR